MQTDKFKSFNNLTITQYFIYYQKNKKKKLD